jgi:hypothetical protein
MSHPQVMIRNNLKSVSANALLENALITGVIMHFCNDFSKWLSIIITLEMILILFSLF